MRYRVANLAILLTLLLYAAPARPAVEVYQVRAEEQAPAWVYYMLNCEADVTIRVLPAAGGDPVRTVVFPEQARGKHQYLWTGLRDDGTPAPRGAYYARITAVSNQTQWDPIIGLFKNDDWNHEYPPRPLPACPNSEGFYGIGINRNPSSPYYGRIYVSHKVQKHVFMYEPDGEFIGQMDDSGVTWGVSAPWDISIAGDDYVYVDDRSNRVIHCFTPDGQHMSTSPALNYSKAIFARTDASGVTHVYQTGGPTIREITLAADHVTWGSPCNSYTPGTNNLATLGIWVSPDLATIYNCYSEDTGTTNPGLTRWQYSGGCTYLRDSWTSAIANPVVDADMGIDNTFLWVTRMVDSTSGRAINKVRVADGTPYFPPDADYDVVSWGLMCCADAVGNVGVTFGKSTTTWAQYYWGLFAEPGVSQAEKTTSQFVVNATDLTSARAMPSGAAVDVRGIVTGRWTDFFYIEDPERQVGIRVLSDTPVAPGDWVEVAGTLVTQAGERAVSPAGTPVVLSSGNPIPAAYDLTTRDLGGSDYDSANPGVTNGRGALNVGLRAHLQGMVTARDPGGQWFYVWDGANASDSPVDDGAGRLGVRVQSTLDCEPWVDWVDVTGVVGADSGLVAGRVIPVLLATSAEKVTSFDTISSPAGEALTAGWNLIGLPVAPAGTGDAWEYSPKPWDAFRVLSATDDPNDVDGRLYRWENCTGGLNIWDLWSEVESHGTFGGIVLGDGYWFVLDDGRPVSYPARISALDRWIGVCAPGWAIIGQPKTHDTAFADVRVHDGGQVWSMYDAVLTNNWIDCTGWWWDNSVQGLVDIGIDDCWAGTNTLMPWHGYWIQFYRGDLALIVPEN